MADIQINSWTVLFSDHLIDLLDYFRQRTTTAAEAGGILLGEVSHDTVLVNRASPPTRFDRRSRKEFIRDRNSAQATVDYEHFISGGQITYLGEWHTHPADAAQPSKQDLCMIKTQFRENDVPAEFLLLLILGIERDYVGLFDGVNIHSSQHHLRRKHL